MEDLMLESRIPLIATGLHARVLVGMKPGVELVAERAKQRVPVGAPDVHLRDAIHVDTTPGGFAVIAGDDQAFYGHIVEGGGVHSAPHPFLVPALEESRDEVVNLVAVALRGL